MALGSKKFHGAVLGLLMVVWAGQVAQVRGQLDTDDPWPKFGHDVRNSCYTANRGPHSEPQLRWWGKAGFGLSTNPNASSYFRAGPAIAEIQGVRCILIAGNFPHPSVAHH